MQPDLFSPSIQAERAARDSGMAAAAAHADRVTPNWSSMALNFFIDFVATTTAPFMTEDVRQAADGAGLPPPPDARAWGAVATAAARRKIIKRIGYGPQRAAGCHMAPKSIWRKA